MNEVRSPLISISEGSEDEGYRTGTSMSGRSLSGDIGAISNKNNPRSRALDGQDDDTIVYDRAAASPHREILENLVRNTGRDNTATQVAQPNLNFLSSQPQVKSFVSKDFLRRPQTAMGRSNMPVERPRSAMGGPMMMSTTRAGAGTPMIIGNAGGGARRINMANLLMMHRPSTRIPLNSRLNLSSISESTLPAIPEIFYGREDIVSTLVRHIIQGVEDRRGIHISLLGPIGVGKSTTALAVIHDFTITHTFKSQRYFIACDGITTSDDLITALHKSLQMPDASRLAANETDDPLDKLIAFADDLSGRQSLFVFDNFDSAWISSSLEERSKLTVILSRLSSLDHLTIMLTVRGSQLPSHAQSLRWDIKLPIAALPIAAAKQIFYTISRRNMSDIPEALLENLLRRVDLMPHAISLLARMVEKGEKVDALLGKTLLEGSMLGNGGVSRGMDLAIKFTMESKFLAERPLSIRVLSVIALHPHGILQSRLVDPSSSVIDLSSVMDRGEVFRTIELLESMSLIKRQGLNKDRLTMLAPIQDYIRLHHPPDLTDERALYLHYTRIARSAASDSGNSPVRERLESDSGNIRFMLLRFLSRSSVAEQEDIAWSILYFSDYLRTWATPDPELIQLLLNHLTRPDSPSPSPLLHARIIDILGDTYHIQGQNEKAVEHLEDARARYGSLSPGSVVSRYLAECLRTLGSVQCLLGHYDLAKTCVRESCDLSSSLPGVEAKKEMVTSLCGLADIFYMEQNFVEARPILVDAQLQFYELGDRYGGARCQQQLGQILLQEGRSTEAFEPLNKAKDEFSRLGFKLREVECEIMLAEVCRFEDDIEGSRKHLDKALPVLETLDHQLVLAKWNQVLGNILMVEEKYIDAEVAFRKAMDMFAKIGYGIGLASCAQTLGDVMLQQEELLKAREAYESAFNEYTVMDMKSDALKCKMSIGDCLWQIPVEDGGSASEAVTILTETVQGFKDLEDIPMAAKTLLYLGYAMSANEQQELALRVLTTASEMFEEIEEDCRYFKALSCEQRAAVCQVTGNVEQAKEFFRQAKDVWLEIDEEVRVEYCDSCIRELEI